MHFFCRWSTDDAFQIINLNKSILNNHNSSWESLVATLHTKGHLFSDIKDKHKIQFTTTGLIALLKSVGFDDVFPVEYCDERGNIISSDWSMADGPIRRSTLGTETGRSLVVDLIKSHHFSAETISNLIIDISPVSLEKSDGFLDIWKGLSKMIIRKLRKNIGRQVNVFVITATENVTKSYTIAANHLISSIEPDFVLSISSDELFEKEDHFLKNNVLNNDLTFILTCRDLSDPFFKRVDASHIIIVSIYMGSDYNDNCPAPCIRTNMKNSRNIKGLFGISDIDSNIVSDDRLLAIRRFLSSSTQDSDDINTILNRPYIIILTGDTYAYDRKYDEEEFIQVLEALAEAITDGFNYRGAKRRHETPWLLLFGSLNINREPYISLLTDIFWVNVRNYSPSFKTDAIAGAVCVIYYPIPLLSSDSYNCLHCQPHGASFYPVLFSLSLGTPVIAPTAYLESANNFINVGTNKLESTVDEETFLKINSDLLGRSYQTSQSSVQIFSFFNESLCIPSRIDPVTIWYCLRVYFSRLTNPITTQTAAQVDTRNNYDQNDELNSGKITTDSAVYRQQHHQFVFDELREKYLGWNRLATAIFRELINK